MTRTATETRSVSVEREMPYPPEKIWRALPQPHLIAEWLMKNDFKPVVDHRFNLSGDWGSVDCQVLAIEPNKTLSYTWSAMGLESVVTWTLTPTRTGTCLRMEQSGFRPDQQQAYQGSKFGWQKFFANIEQVLARAAHFQGGFIELEQLDSADAPLAVDRLYPCGPRQLCRHGIGDTSSLGGLLTAASALPVAVDRALHVRLALCRQLARRATRRRAGVATMSRVDSEKEVSVRK